MDYKNKSIWMDIEPIKYLKKLEDDIDVDVLIIGGGITGISTAYHLINSNLNVCLVEKNKIGMGVTSKTTAKLTFLQEDIYSKLEKYHGKSKAKLYLDSQIDAIRLVKEIIDKENIRCDLKKVDSYVFSNSKDVNLDSEMNLLNQFNISLKKANILPNKESVNEAFYVCDTYVFHPLKYLYSLTDIVTKKDILIYEDTKVISINKEANIYICKTENNKIKTKYIVFAMHYPYFLTPFFMPLKSSIEKSYIKAFKVDDYYNFSAINTSKPTISIRYHKNNKVNYQIYLTNSHNLCVKNNYKDNFKGLINEKNKPDYLWANKDIVTNDLLPFIGAINNDNNLLIGTGYNTWGMTNGSLAGKILADLILDKRNKYIELFNPKRSLNLGKIVNFPSIIGGNVYSFIKSKIKKQKSWYPSNVKFERRNGKNVGIYIDENKKEHIVYNLCPHMKCSLIFNEIEKTWDCPCHGSRFDLDGNSIEGPSNYNITYKE